MASCSHSTLYVYNAGFSDINGTYLSAGDISVNGNLFTVYTKDGNPSSTPKIKASYNSGPKLYYWEIDANIPSYGVNSVYDSTIASPLTAFNNCPFVTFHIVNGPWGGEAYLPAPVVSSDPDPYAPWGGFANWQRLRLLEYV